MSWRDDPDAPPGADAGPTRDLPTPARALAVGAHPDDVEFGCGATLAKWAAAGCELHLLVLTDGSKGTWDPDADLDALVARRRAEQQAAFERLGGTGTVTFLDRTDGELDADRATRAEVAACIRRTRPDVVLGHDPWKRHRMHPDHRAAGFLTVDGVVDARDPHFHRDQGLAHHRPEALLLFEADEVHHVEDVTGWGEHKVEALLAHESQHASTMGIEADDPAGAAAARAAFERKVRADLARAGAAAGVTEAEAFARLDPAA